MNLEPSLTFLSRRARSLTRAALSTEQGGKKNMTAYRKEVIPLIHKSSGKNFLSRIFCKEERIVQTFHILKGIDTDDYQQTARNEIDR